MAAVAADPTGASAAPPRGHEFAELGAESNRFSPASANSGVLAIEQEGTNGIRAYSALSNWYSEPPMRLRLSRSSPDPDGAKHFLIVPYQYGLAMEYPGNIEVWSAAFSLHNHTQAVDSGARLWVGNDLDTGGLFMTARLKNGERWAEIVPQLFNRRSGGNLKFGVRDADDEFEFRSGSEGNERTVLRINAGGDLDARADSDAAVRVGSAGPGGEAGVAFGPERDASVYRDSEGSVTVGARLVVDGPLAFANAEPVAGDNGQVARVRVFDAEGNPLGYLPIYDESL